MRIAVMLSCLLLTSCSGDGVGVAFDTDAQSAEVQQDCSLWPEATVDAMINVAKFGRDTGANRPEAEAIMLSGWEFITAEAINCTDAVLDQVYGPN